MFQGNSKWHEQIKFIEKYVICTVKHVYVKNVYKLVKYGFSSSSLSKKMEWKHTDSPVKETVSGAMVSKEDHADSLLEQKRFSSLMIS